MIPRLTWLGLAGLALCMAAAGYFLARGLEHSRPALASGTWLPAPRSIAPLALTDQSGAAFTQAQLAGAPTVVFFGFTHCPDVCPTTLLKLARARAAAHASWRVVFVSLDPGRDSPALLAQYLHAFDSSFVGLTGSAAAIGELAARFGVAFARVDLPGGDYTIDHSATLFLLDREGRMVAVFTPPFDEARLAADLDAAARS